MLIKIGYPSNIKVVIPLACVASVPARSEQNLGHAKEFFAFGPGKKWGKTKKVEGRRWGRGRKDACSQTP